MTADRRRVAVTLTAAQVDTLIGACAERDITLEDRSDEEAPYGPDAVAERRRLRRAWVTLQRALDDLPPRQVPPS